MQLRAQPPKTQGITFTLVIIRIGLVETAAEKSRIGGAPHVIWKTRTLPQSAEDDQGALPIRSPPPMQQSPFTRTFTRSTRHDRTGRERHGLRSMEFGRSFLQTVEETLEMYSMSVSGTIGFG